MHTSMKFTVMTGIVSLIATVVGQASAIEPAYVAARPIYASNVYVAPESPRTTLVSRPSLQEVNYGNRDIIPIESLPVVSVPARDVDVLPLTNISNVRQANYQQAYYESNYPTYTQQQPTTRYYGPTVMPTSNTVACTQPTLVTYPPTQYNTPRYSYMPNYMPIGGVPQTVYSPLMPVQSNLQIGSGIYGQPVIYRPGQPVRNAVRWLTP